MKKLLSWGILPLLLITGVGCKKKEVTSTGTVTAGSGIETLTAVKKVDQPIALTPRERAEMHGFAQFLPKDIEMVVSVHNGSEIESKVTGSKLWQIISGDVVQADPVLGVPKEEAVTPENAAEEGAGNAAQNQEMGPAVMFGKEFTMAMGDKGGEQLNNLVQLNRRLSYFRMRDVVTSYSKALASGKSTPLMRMMANPSMSMLKSILMDEGVLAGQEQGIVQFEKMQMPPLYFAFKTSDEMRQAAAQQLSSMVQMVSMADGVLPVEVKHGESVFRGLKVPGTMFAEMMTQNRSELEKSLPVETVDRLIKAITTKNLVAMSGIIDQYVVFFLGSSEQDLVIAASPDESLLATDAFAFGDAYKGKRLAALVYCEEEGIMKALAEGRSGLGDMAAGMRDGLSLSDQLGDTRSLEAILRMVEEREAALYALAKMNGSGTIAFFEEGLKIESYGGYDSGMVDWEVPNRLAPLGDREGVAMFANVTTDAVFDVKARAYIEALMETAYASAMKFAEFPVNGQNLIEFRNGAQLFDAKFRGDLVSFWNAFNNGYSSSLGAERAWVMDLKGSMPAVPGLPQTLVDQAKVPRVSMVAPVVDRTKLAASWQEMNSGLTSLMGSVSEVISKPIPMQKPMSSEKDGSTSWFIAMPFFNDDFLPSVTVNDQWFAASTSKNQALDLLKQAAAGGETSSGFNMRVDFKLLDEYASQSVKLVWDHKDKLHLSAAQISDLRNYSKSMEDWDQLNIHVRREGGVLRSSMHFKTR